MSKGPACETVLIGNQCATGSAIIGRIASWANSASVVGVVVSAERGWSDRSPARLDRVVHLQHQVGGVLAHGIVEQDLAHFAAGCT